MSGGGEGSNVGRYEVCISASISRQGCARSVDKLISFVGTGVQQLVF